MAMYYVGYDSMCVCVHEVCKERERGGGRERETLACSLPHRPVKRCEEDVHSPAGGNQVPLNSTSLGGCLHISLCRPLDSVEKQKGI